LADPGQLNVVGFGDGSVHVRVLCEEHTPLAGLMTHAPEETVQLLQYP